MLSGPARLAVLLALAALVFGDTLWGEREFFYRDVTRQYAPVQAQLGQAWARDELPLWNQSTQGGVPLLANLHAGALAPWSLVFRALEFSRAYALVVALAWAAWVGGLYRWLARHAAPVPAALGALTGGLSGVALGATSYLPYLVGLACLPWQLVALRVESPLRRTAALAALFALQVLSGDPSTALMGALAVVVVGTLEDQRPWTSLLGAGPLALGLSAAQLLPSWALFQESARAGASLDARLAWSFHPQRVLEWFVRAPYGQLLREPFFARWDLAAGPDAQPFLLEHGWGLLALLATGAALTHRGRLRTIALALVGLGFALSLGRWLGPLKVLHDVPPFSFFRFPERFAALVALGATALTAHGLGILGDAPAIRRRWAVVWLGLALPSGLGALAAHGALREALLFTAALLAGAGAWGALTARARWAWAVGLVVAALIEGGRAARLSVLTLERAPLPEVALPGPGRVWRDNPALRALERPVRGEAALARERRELHATFASATPGLHGVEELGGYSPVSLRRWQRVIQATANRPHLLSALFDVCWFVSTPARAAEVAGWSATGQLTEGATLYRSAACQGRAWTVERALDVSEGEAELSGLLAPGFDPRAVAVRVAGSPLPALERVEVRLNPRPRPGLLEAELAPHAGWALLVVSESWAPGWRATVDGQLAEVERLDGTLLGVAVPPGKQSVRLEYEEPLFSAGLGLSAATALGLALAWLRRRGGAGGPLVKN